MTASVLKQDPNTKRFKRPLIEPVRVWIMNREYHPLVLGQNILE